jgi:DNA-binding winged helix-turn-helix (wHTH) protein
VVYRFGDFRLDHGIRQLFHAGAEVHLSPKAFELLTLLLENHARAVSKAELQERLWPATFVEETNLAGLVTEIRRALHDSPSNPAFVRTVYGFGYRFVGSVTVDAVMAHPGMPRAKLHVVLGRREIVLMEGPNIIGREPDAAIQVDARGVSRHHARILVAGNAATLDDLGSKNGTYLNGSRIAGPVRLSDGDDIRLGTIQLRFRIASTAGPTETVATGDV